MAPKAKAVPKATAPAAEPNEPAATTEAAPAPLTPEQQELIQWRRQIEACLRDHASRMAAVEEQPRPQVFEGQRLALVARNATPAKAQYACAG